MPDLAGSRRSRTVEWLGVIGRLDGALPDGHVNELLAPYLSAVEAARLRGANLYPGSPWIVRHLLRRQDRLSALELHPEQARLLGDLFAGEFQVRVTELDGWLALGAHVPPKEKRGLVLVDPPFERDGEFERLAEGAITAHRRWSGGVLALWYPIKDRNAVQDFRQRMAASGIEKVLDLSLMIRKPSAQPTLDGCGMMIVNPPYTLEAEMAQLLPALAAVLRLDDGAGSDVVWLSRSTSNA